MGTQVGRIEKEFVFKTLVDDKVPCDVHGSRKEFACRFSASTDDRLEMSPVEGTIEGIRPGGRGPGLLLPEEQLPHLRLARPGDCSGTHRCAAAAGRVQEPPAQVREGETAGLNRGLVQPARHKGGAELPEVGPVQPGASPKPDSTFDPRRIQEVVKAFRVRMETMATDNKIVMLRDRMPRAWEEKTIVRLGKSLWIPSTAEDFPAKDPFPDERIITKSDLVALEEEAGSPAYVITSKLGNILYEKTKKEIVSELWCPVLYNEYVVGYVHVWNTADRRERISRDLVDYVQQFAKVLCYSMVTNGYFKVENSTERRYEAPDHRPERVRPPFCPHRRRTSSRTCSCTADLELTVRLDRRTIPVGGRIMRKFRDAENTYFGLLFLKISDDDFSFLFHYLYGKEFDPSLEGRWEGGAPPPPLDMS